MTTLTKKISDNGLGTTPIHLASVVKPVQLWSFPEGWHSITDHRLPQDSMVSANPSQTVDGQTSVTVASAWSISGEVDPVSLLTAIEDPIPEGAEKLSHRQDGPELIPGGAGAILYVTYRINELVLKSFTRFDLLAGPRGASADGGVLVQRTFNSPVDEIQPKCLVLSGEAVGALLSQVGESR